MSIEDEISSPKFFIITIVKISGGRESMPFSEVESKVFSTPTFDRKRNIINSWHTQICSCLATLITSLSPVDLSTSSTSSLTSAAEIVSRTLEEGSSRFRLGILILKTSFLLEGLSDTEFLFLIHIQISDQFNLYF